MMLCLTLLALICCGITSAGVIQARSSSYSGEYGGGGGKRFSHSGNQLDGPITAIRLRVSRYYIVGLQVRYGKQWSDYVGGSSGDLEEIFLHPGESITQVSGKYKHYLRKIVFITDKGRYFPFGKDTGTSFNAAPLYPGTVLRYFSGSSGSLIDAIGLHWDSYPSNCPSCGK
ncbi:zymogen granule membrane protein 16-like [Sceloporus undulatus]|uniref:zymogen granule membrane protein 16-like n=1 Tax=Sceloporus undulatus TaxID=8520 RepID=UPI001C4D1301|nr:zymogen granule membrane protein 16-like [Sceloporus undulatus]XP_042327680.1 zymogen granule membrane protein 16-like [Sceloporus undulatus]